MCTRFVVHGGGSRDTQQVIALMGERQIPYRLELRVEGTTPVVLSTPAGRFYGLAAIRQAFGTSRKRRVTVG